MSKTIEKLAKQYAEDMCPVGDYCGGVYDEQRHNDLPIYTDDAKSVLSWLFALPLASRLTAEEKERVNKAYAYAITHIEFDENRAEVRLLHRIFGKDFFKEEE